MHKNILSLVFFTLASQAGVGLYLVYRLGQLTSGSYTGSLHGLMEKRILFLVAGLLLLALLISFTHLGSPLHSIHALNNLSSSWLSREILSLSVLVILVCLEILTRVSRGSFAPGMLAGLSLAILGTGMMLVYFMSRIYMLPTVPSWNHPATPVSFFISLALSGLGLLLAVAVFSSRDPALSLPGNSGRMYLLFLGAFLLIDMATFLFITPWFYGNLLASILALSCLLASMAIVLLIMFQEPQQDLSVRTWIYVMILLIGISLVIRRILFFHAYERIGV